MCQQTRVETVVQYYDKWMRRWPTVHALAAASLEQVNELWAGLGYYRRARFLLQGAQHVVNQLGGRFPCDVATLKKVRRLLFLSRLCAAQGGVGFANGAVALGPSPTCRVFGGTDRVVSAGFLTRLKHPASVSAMRPHRDGCYQLPSGRKSRSSMWCLPRERQPVERQAKPGTPACTPANLNASRRQLRD